MWRESNHPIDTDVRRSHLLLISIAIAFLFACEFVSWLIVLSNRGGERIRQKGPYTHAVHSQRRGSVEIFADHVEMLSAGRLRLAQRTTTRASAGNGERCKTHSCERESRETKRHRSAEEENLTCTTWDEALTIQSKQHTPVPTNPFFLSLASTTSNNNHEHRRSWNLPVLGIG